MGLPTAIRNAENEANTAIQGAKEPSTPEGNTDDKPTNEQSATQPENQTPAQTATDLGDDWQAKYKVLQGKYNAEVPRMREQLDELRNQVMSGKAANDSDGRVQEQLTQLQSANEQLQQELADAKRQPAKLDEHLIENYGEDFAQAVARQSDEQSKAVVSQLETQINELKSQLSNVTQSSQKTSADMVISALEHKLRTENIDFDQVDSDPLFHEWLAQPDELSGQQRGTLMREAFQSGDVGRTAGFYRSYKAHERSTLQSNPFDKHVDVAQPNSAPDTGSQQADHWTPQDIEALYDAYASGRINDAQFKEQEQNLFRAMQSGNYTA